MSFILVSKYMLLHAHWLLQAGQPLVQFVQVGPVWLPIIVFTMGTHYKYIHSPVY